MKDGFVKVAVGTPKIRVADCVYNAEAISSMIREAEQNGAKMLALPELCVTGYTCGDLFCSDSLLDAAEDALVLLDAAGGLGDAGVEAAGDVGHPVHLGVVPAGHPLLEQVRLAAEPVLNRKEEQNVSDVIASAALISRFCKHLAERLILLEGAAAQEDPGAPD